MYIPPWDLLADKPPRQNFGTSDKFSQDSGFPQRGGCSRTTSSSDLELFRCASVDAQSTMTGGLDPHQQHMLMMRQFPPGSNMMNGMCIQEFSGTPDRTFRVVMCGDASVGKSSIIMRIIKGAFQPNIASTLGVDFHVKSVRVGTQNIAVQLWDTAGQERFRSLCNSYFRRADGAILVYDCSIDRSFLRIRDWIETVKVVGVFMTCLVTGIEISGNVIPDPKNFLFPNI
uniref:Ras family protein n=1 Tax=Meloidogyne incognita TaxID=6306 RepID=A0A914MXX5_MELIC